MANNIKLIVYPAKDL